MCINGVGVSPYPDYPVTSGILVIHIAVGTWLVTFCTLGICTCCVLAYSYIPVCKRYVHVCVSL